MQYPKKRVFLAVLRFATLTVVRVKVVRSKTLSVFEFGLHTPVYEISIAQSSKMQLYVRYAVAPTSQSILHEI